MAKQDQVREVLQDLYDERGELTPEMVVEEARDPGHPLHGDFEWDNSVAAEAYRRGQAAGLIRMVKVTYAIDDDTGRNKTTRAFVSAKDPQSQKRSYVPTEQIVLDPLRYQMLLADFRRDWGRFHARWSNLQEFREVLLGDLAAQAQEAQEDHPQTG